MNEVEKELAKLRSGSQYLAELGKYFIADAYLKKTITLADEKKIQEKGYGIIIDTLRNMPESEVVMFRAGSKIRLDNAVNTLLQLDKEGVMHGDYFELQVSELDGALNVIILSKLNEVLDKMPSLEDLTNPPEKRLAKELLIL